MVMATELTQVIIGGVDRSADVLRVELTRTMNSVGTWMAVLRNINDAYNGVFDVQDDFQVDVDGNTLMEGRVDGPAVTRIGKDLESTWDEYIVLRGVDQAQDLLFHNDFDYYYPDVSAATQQIHTVLNDIFNVQIVASTNITYAPPIVSPAIGSVEFREGASFLGILQEMFRSAGWLFYVDDALALQSGAPGFSNSGVTLQSIAGNANSNIIDLVEVVDADGDKLYNYVKLYGKNPMFDGYTELNAAEWTAQIGGVPSLNILDDNGNVRVGGYSQVVFNGNPVAGPLSHLLTLPQYNYTVWDFSKGEIGFWGYYDNVAAAPGAPPPAAGTSPANERAEIRIWDTGGNMLMYYGESTRLYVGEWGWCGATLGEKYDNTMIVAPDQWSNLLGGTFDWNNVVQLELQFPTTAIAPTSPSHFYIDGITMPLPCIAVSNNPASQAAYRNRPYIDSFPNFQTQNSLQAQADRFLAQHQDTCINQIKLVTPGNSALHYAGQTVTITVPSLGFVGALAYMSEIHHVIEPYVDVSNGFGFDWVTEVNAIPISGVFYDMGRLRDGPSYSAMQMGNRAAVGTRIK